MIKKKFGPDSDDWQEYAQWAGLEHCEAYYSIDRMRRESLFTPKSVEDFSMERVTPTIAKPSDLVWIIEKG